MHTKIGSKRKSRQLLIKSIKVCFLFVITLGILISITTFFYNRKKIVLSPIATAKTTKNTYITSENNTEVISQLLEQNHLTPSAITIGSDSAILVTLKNGPEVTFSSAKDLSQQITSLQLIMSHLTIEGKRFTRVDFRFDNPIIGK